MFTQLLADAAKKQSHFHSAVETRTWRRKRRAQRLSSKLAA